MAMLEQSYFEFEHGRWTSCTSKFATSVAATIPSEKVVVHVESENEAGKEDKKETDTIRVVTWNIDCFMPYQSLRMCSAMKYLGELLESADASIPAIIFLQETTADDLSIIEKMDWVRRGYIMTDLKIPMRSRMGRDGLFVDLLHPNAAIDASANGLLRIRLCNVHLESLVANPPLRPGQMALVASYLQSKDVHGGVVAGDFNAIQDFDRNFHTDHDLVDVYLALGGKENSDSGYTWGFQSTSKRSKSYPPCRMDKILCTDSFQPLELRRIGVGVKVSEEKCENKHAIELQSYFSDHYGLMGKMSLKPGRNR